VFHQGGGSFPLLPTKDFGGAAIKTAVCTEKFSDLLAAIQR